MKYKIALIGCGRISTKHIEAIANNSNVLELVATADPVFAKAEQKKADYIKNNAKAAVVAYADYKQMLIEQNPHIVTIATESGLHKQISLDCLNAGCHVIVEKPMALSSCDAQEMIDLAQAKGRKLGVCFQNRFNAPVQRLRTAYEAGRLGRIMHGMVQIRWNRNDAYYAEAPWRGTWEQDGGTLMNQCTHGIDLLQWMMGENAVRVQAQTRRFMRPIEAEDFGAAIVEFASGAVGIIEGSAVIYPKNLNETLSIFGDRGSVVIGGVAVNKMETWRLADAETIGDTEELVLTPHEKDPPTVYGHGHTALFADFVDAIKVDRDPLISGEKGKHALDIILAIYESQKTGRPIDLPNNFSTLDMQGEFD